MPVYVYECKAGHVTEVIQCMVDRDKPVPCAICGKKTQRVAAPTPGIVRDPAVPRSRT